MLRVKHKAILLKTESDAWIATETVGLTPMVIGR